MPQAARYRDEVEHSSALTGLLVGAAAGLLIGAAIIAGPILLAGAGVAAAGAALCTGGAVFAMMGTISAGAMIGEALGHLSFLNSQHAIAQPCSPNVHINSRNAARAIADKVEPHKQGSSAHSSMAIAEGSSSVFINRFPAARLGDEAQCGAPIISGSPNVYIGGDRIEYLEVTPEVPGWLHWGMTALGLISGVGMVRMGLVTIAGLVRAAVLGTAGSAAGSEIGSWFGKDGEIIGSLLGGLAGGRPGFKRRLGEMPHNQFLKSETYKNGLALGAPELDPVGIEGGGFVSARPVTITAPPNAPKKLYNVGDGRNVWWSETAPPNTLGEHRVINGVIPNWSKAPKRVATITIPPGKSLPPGWEGRGAPAYQDGAIYPAGKKQINLDPSKIPKEWITEAPLPWAP